MVMNTQTTSVTITGTGSHRCKMREEAKMDIVQGEIPTTNPSEGKSEMLVSEEKDKQPRKSRKKSGKKNCIVTKVAAKATIVENGACCNLVSALALLQSRFSSGERVYINFLRAAV